MTTAPAARLDRVSVVHDGRTVLGPLDLVVEPHDRWVVIGPNGSGKTSLVAVMSMYQRPATGTVEILGEQWGRVDVRAHRTRIGLSSSSLRRRLHDRVTVADVVMTARHGALEPWWHRYDDTDRAAAMTALDRVGMTTFADRMIGTLSSGEQQRTLLARALFGRPGLLLLDEPTAGLDIGGRSELVATLSDLADDATAPPVVLVTHHADEIPDGFTHALLLRDGEVVASGPIDTALTEAHLRTCLGRDFEPASTPEPAPGGSELTDLVVDYFAACTSGTAEEIAAHFTTDAVIWDTNHPPVRGAAAIGGFWDRIRAKWVGAAWTVDRVVDDGRAVAIEWTMTGTHADEPFAVSGSEHYGFGSGPDGRPRIAEIRQYWTFDPAAPGSGLVDHPDAGGISAGTSTRD